MKQTNKYRIFGVTSLLWLFVLLFLIAIFPANKVQAAEQTGSVGLEGRINADPPKSGATITLPRDGTSTSSSPITVSGICPKDLLVKIFKNNVFAGSAPCTNGSFSIQIDLFAGRNELVARVYDDLDQAGPDSNTVVVNVPFGGTIAANRISLTSAFARRGANPGQLLTWPITLTGGTGPYAITVDWGDGKTQDIISQAFPGTFNISHTYDSAGVYNVIIRATDKDKNLAFLQLVGVANGPVGQNNSGNSQGGSTTTTTRIKVLWQPVLVAIPLIVSAFWLGRRHELFSLRKRLEQREDIS